MESDGKNMVDHHLPTFSHPVSSPGIVFSRSSLERVRHSHSGLTLSHQVLETHFLEIFISKGDCVTGILFLTSMSPCLPIL